MNGTKKEPQPNDFHVNELMRKLSFVWVEKRNKGWNPESAEIPKYTYYWENARGFKYSQDDSAYLVSCIDHYIDERIATLEGDIQP